MRRQIKYPLLAITIALAMRLYSTLISGMPFSTDAWPPIRNSELILQNTPINLDDKIFDGYHNYWPANSIFGAATSLLTSLRPMDSITLFSVGKGISGTIILFTRAQQRHSRMF